MKFRLFFIFLAAAAALAVPPFWAGGAAWAEPGGVIWETTYPGEPGDEDYRAGGLAQDQQGNIFVAGTLSEKAGGKDYLTLKYGPDGTGRWARRYNLTWYDVGRAVSSDLIGDSVVAGASDNLNNPRDTYSHSYYTDYRVVKYDPTGEVMYEMSASGNGTNNEPSSVAVDYDGDIYVTGYTYSASGAYRTFYTVKFSATGKLLWERIEDWGAESVATCVKVDADGSVLVAGYLLDPVNNDNNIKVMRYSPGDGRPLMEITYDHQHDDEKAYGLAVDEDGSIYVTGETGTALPVTNVEQAPLPAPPGTYTQAPPQDTTTLLLKFSPAGKLDRSETFTGSSYRNRGTAIAIDIYGRVYVAGRTHRPDSAGDILLLLYDKSGRLSDDRTYSYGHESYPAGMALDKDGDIVIACTVNQPDMPGEIRTMKLTGYPPPEPAISEEMAFDPAVQIKLKEPVPRMLRKVELTATTTDIVEGSPVVLFAAKVVGPPGEYEYRFFISDSPDENSWVPVTEYSGADFWVYRPGRWEKKPVKVMVRVRPAGSGLEHEATQTVDYAP